MNIYSFFCTYASLDNFKPHSEKINPEDLTLLDKWIIAKANEGFKGNIKFKIGEKITIPMEIGEIVSELERLNNRVD